MVTKEWVAVTATSARVKPLKTRTAHNARHQAVLWTAPSCTWRSGKRRHIDALGHGTPDDWIEAQRIFALSTGKGRLDGRRRSDSVSDSPARDLGRADAMDFRFMPQRHQRYRHCGVIAITTRRTPAITSCLGHLDRRRRLHNNHHHTRHRPSFNQVHEFDIGWVYIRALQALGLAKVLRVAPKPQVAEPKRSIDLETLQAVISNRYDLLAKYARSLKVAHRDELQKLRLSGDERARFARLRRVLRKGDVSKLAAAEQHSLSDMMKQSR